MSSSSDSEDMDLYLLGHLCAINSAAAMYLKKKRESKNLKTRREWVKKWKLKRTNKSSLHLLNQELRLEDINSYRMYLHMDEDCFIELLDSIKPQLLRQDTQMRSAISPAEALSCVLRFLSSGESYRSLQIQGRMSLAYISERVPEICRIIYESLKDKHLKFPTSTHEWLRIAEHFDRRWKFPLCIGAMDGMNVVYRASKADVDYFYNHKGLNSIVLLAMCDADYKFTFVDIGCNGYISDEDVLNRSELRNVLLHAERYLPKNKFIGDNRFLPYVIIGDDDFSLERHLMTPYPCNSTEEYKKNFNFRLSHARQPIKHAFGVLSNRFKVLQSNIHLRHQKVVNVVQACVTLHNFLITRSRNYLDESSHESYTPDMRNTEDNRIEDDRTHSNEASNIRSSFAEYFTNEGKILLD